MTASGPRGSGRLHPTLTVVDYAEIPLCQTPSEGGREAALQKKQKREEKARERREQREREEEELEERKQIRQEEREERKREREKARGQQESSS